MEFDMLCSTRSAIDGQRRACVTGQAFVNRWCVCGTGCVVGTVCSVAVVVVVAAAATAASASNSCCCCCCLSQVKVEWTSTSHRSVGYCRMVATVRDLSNSELAAICAHWTPMFLTNIYTHTYTPYIVYVYVRTITCDSATATLATERVLLRFCLPLLAIFRRPVTTVVASLSSSNLSVPSLPLFWLVVSVCVARASCWSAVLSSTITLFHSPNNNTTSNNYTESLINFIQCIFRSANKHRSPNIH